MPDISDFPIPAKWLVAQIHYTEDRTSFWVDGDDRMPSFFKTREEAVETAHRWGEDDPDKMFMVLKADLFIRPLPRTYSETKLEA